MKPFFTTLITLLLLTIAPVFLHAENTEFEEFSLTASMKANLWMNSLGDIPVQKGVSSAGYIQTDLTYSFATAVELTGAYNWQTVFLGLSLLGTPPMRAEGDYKIVRSMSGQSASRSFYMDQYTVGALLEFGMCRSSQDWVFASTGAYAKTTYGDADHHTAIGFGPYYRSVESNLKQLESKDFGWIASFRYQYLLFWDIGIEADARIFVQEPYFDNAVYSFELGVFYKII